ncbi:zinc finger BED domain-containing protein 4-like [Spodoptera litura]|uniref:Zinc finger BED domain-containing protein 4-like n=1 Tax=Spodoptera litura TaxID=69820 RepID=A0A9J7ETW3_SPOLT|nr:zinc finger BED domain-containing protein 4-like [Spodoptera litura]
MLNADLENPAFLKHILWTDESKFDKDGITNYHNAHYWASKENRNPNKNQDVVTRWDSTLHALRRLLEQRVAVQASLPHVKCRTELATQEWVLMEQVVSALTYFEEATKSVSQESACLSDAIPLINSLRRVLERIKNTTAMDDNAYSPEYNAFILHLIAGINDRFDYLENDETFILATALDPRYKLRTFTLQTTSMNAKSMLISLITNNTYTENPHSAEAPRQNQNEIFSGIWSACDSLIKEAEDDEPLSNMSIQPEQEEVESYLRFPNIPIKQDPKIYWRQEDKYPKLKNLAQKYLSYPMSSVASERLFSTAGLIQNDLRNRLSADNLNKLCFLNKNLPKVDFNY